MNFCKLKLYPLLLLLILSISLSGCAPKGDPQQAITSYYQNVKDGNIDAAYNTLATEAKKATSKDDFSLYQNLQHELGQFKDFKISKVTDDKNNTLDGVTFKNITAFDVTEVEQTYYDNKEKTSTSRGYVVNDNGSWKMYRKITKSDISSDYVMLGQMYADGKGKDKDLVKAVEYLKKAADSDSNSIIPLYALSSVYLDMRRFDDSITEAKLVIDKSKDDKQKSDVYNVLGLDYLAKNDTSNARQAFEQALKLNPDNEYAKNNMNKYIK